MATLNQLNDWVPPYARRLAQDGVGVSGPFLLRTVRVTGDGTNNGLVTLYDGRDTGGEILDQVRVTANDVSTIHYPDGLKCKNGVYVDLTDVNQVVIFGYPLEP